MSTPSNPENDPSVKKIVHQHVERGTIVGDYAKIDNLNVNIPETGSAVSPPVPAASVSVPKKKIPANLFISYRRQASLGFAILVRERLQEHIDGTIFIDFDGLGAGPFNMQLLDELQKSDIVLLLVGATTFDRINEPDDWVCREIQEGMKRILIPVLHNNAPIPLSSTLPDSIRGLPALQGVRIYEEHLDSSIAKLCTYIEKAVVSR